LAVQFFGSGGAIIGGGRIALHLVHLPGRSVDLLVTLALVFHHSRDFLNRRRDLGCSHNVLFESLLGRDRKLVPLPAAVAAFSISTLVSFAS
jgi:hypothetical protein